MGQSVMKFKKTQLLKCVCVCGCLITGTANAAVDEDSSAPVVRLGGISVYPGLSIAEKHNDNIFRSDANKRSSFITVVSPSVLLETRKGGDAYSLAYSAELASYAQSSDDNYTDQALLGVAELSFSSRASLRLAPQFKSGHEERGSTYAAMTATPNTFHTLGLEGAFTYGSEESIGRIVVDASHYDVRYQNNRSVTTAFDKNLDYVGGTFYYRVSPKVSAFAQLGETRIDYQDAASTLSGNEQRLLVGATWNATAQTSGSFKIGQLQKKFDSALYQTARGTSWEGSVRWSPVEFARVDWVGGRKPAESTGVGDFVWVTSNALDFSYDLNERTRLHLIAAKMIEDFAGSGRTDTTPSYGLKAEYKLRKWLVLGGEYTNAIKTSTGYTGTSPNYDNKIFALSIRSEL